jgi:hypothetical protein
MRRMSPRCSEVCDEYWRRKLVQKRLRRGTGTDFRCASLASRLSTERPSADEKGAVSESSLGSWSGKEMFARF